MIKGIILDFDQTIFDTSKIEYLRNTRQWNVIRNYYHQVKYVKDFELFLEYISNKKFSIAIVSNSPRKKYMEGITKHFNLDVDLIIGYEDVSIHKPYPTPMLLALQSLRLDANEVIAIGDQFSDIISSSKANIKSILYNQSTNRITRKYSIFQSSDYRKIIDFIKKVLIGEE